MVTFHLQQSVPGFFVVAVLFACLFYTFLQAATVLALKELPCKQNLGAMSVSFLCLLVLYNKYTS